MTRATVVVCTRNRSSALAGACESALALETAWPWELLIVDNGSTDDTLEVARAIASRHPGRARVVIEREPGLSAARNLGVHLARGEWLAFLDDDAMPEPGWLDSYARLFAETDSWAAGGPVQPEFAGALPAWFGPEFLPYVSAWDRGGERHRLHYNEFPRGANMAFRRTAFERVGTFDRWLGRRGASLRSCEEIELCLRVERSGGEVLYEPRARVRHQVEAARLTPGWILDRFAAQGFSEAILDWKHFGLSGLRAGLARQAWAARFHAAANPDGPTLLALGHRRALRSYRRGALYAPLVVPRWKPASGGD